MREYLKFYIDGQWVDPVEPKTLDVDNPTTEAVSGKIALGTAADVDKAVQAARTRLRHLVADHPRGTPRRAAGHHGRVRRSAPAIWPTRSARRWAHRRRWRPGPRSTSVWDTWPRPSTC